MLEKLIGEVKGIFNIVTLIDLIISIIYIILGVVFWAVPNMSNMIVSIIIGLFLIANGASAIYAYFKRSGIVLFNYNLYYGIALILVGILTMFLGNFLSILLGVYLIIVSAQKINYGILLKKFHESSWLITVCVGVMFLVIAVISFFTGGNGLIQAAGIILLGVGIINLINTVLLRRRSKNFLA